MSELFVIGYNSAEKAEAARSESFGMAKEYLAPPTLTLQKGEHHEPFSAGFRHDGTRDLRSLADFSGDAAPDR